MGLVVLLMHFQPGTGLPPGVSGTDPDIGRPTKTVGGQLVTAAPRSRSPARGGPGIRSSAVLRVRGLCPDDPHLAAPEDHRALEKLTSHGFGRSRFGPTPSTSSPPMAPTTPYIGLPTGG